MEIAAKKQIQAQAKVLGFDDCQVTEASSPKSANHSNNGSKKAAMAVWVTWKGTKQSALI